MSRCLISVAAALAVAVPVVACAQANRTIAIPAHSLRGEVTFGQPPQVLLNGQATQLSASSRIKDPVNLLVLSSKLVGQKLTVNYTLDTYGLLKDIWLLREDEISQPWPRNAEEAIKWTYDPVQRAWIKP